MSRQVAERCVQLMEASVRSGGGSVRVVDLTGGAPELTLQFRWARLGGWVGGREGRQARGSAGGRVQALLIAAGGPRLVWAAVPTTWLATLWSMQLLPLATAAACCTIAPVLDAPPLAGVEARRVLGAACVGRPARMLRCAALCLAAPTPACPA